MKKRNLFFLWYVLVCFAICLVTGSSIFFAYRSSNKILMSCLNSRLTSNIEAASFYIDPDLHYELRNDYIQNGINGDETSGVSDTRYIGVIEKLRTYAEQVEIEYIYTINYYNDEFYFVLDSDPEIYEDDPTFIGSLYELNKSEKNFFKQVIDNTNEVFITQITDQYGTTLTACKAITRTVNNEEVLETILCLDIQSKVIVNHSRAFIYDAIITYSVLLVGFSVVAIILYRLLKRNEEMRKKIEYMAYFDSLTTLPNRAALIDKLTAMMHALPHFPDYSLAVLFIDVDNFKKVNDAEGHIAGDILLQDIAKFLKSHSNLRPIVTKTKGDNNKEFIARLGGDEFVMIYPFKADGDLVKFLDLLMSNFKKIAIENENMTKYKVSLSIGAAVYPKHGDSVSSMLKTADLAMYNSKRVHKGNYFIYDESIKDLEKKPLER